MSVRKRKLYIRGIERTVGMGLCSSEGKKTEEIKSLIISSDK